MSEVPQIGNADLAHMIRKARTAADGSFGVHSTGEKLVVALLLDRPDWLAEMDYTLADAIERVGPEWARLIPAAARQVENERRQAASAAAERTQEVKADALTRENAPDDTIRFAATLVTWGDAPGYRDVEFVFDLKPTGAPTLPSLRASIRIRPEDGEQVVRHVKAVHRFAWERGEPIDVRPGEKRPTWI
ncbi:MAG: hypothetical protein ACRC67_29685 [Inquilinus sp.]|uniref:hypothetical protein n=1 Tax=Inquilinus sp. TaxID=1932117 RepID=UPI003F29FD79